MAEQIMGSLRALFSSASQISITSAGDYLPILRGTSNTNGQQGWMRIYFSHKFTVAPQVFVQGSPGISKYKPRTVSFSHISIPDVNIPKIDITVPNIIMPDIQKFLIEDINANAWTNTGNPLIDIPQNTAKGPIIALLLIFSVFIGDAFNKFVKEYIKPQFDNIIKVINDLINKLNIQVIGDSANPAAGSINKALDDARIQIETVVNQIAGSMSDALNTTTDRVFEFLGVVDKVPLAITSARNITGDSFEFYSTGGTYSWMAIGVLA
jgi:hypothetical protein